MIGFFISGSPLYFPTLLKHSDFVFCLFSGLPSYLIICVIIASLVAQMVKCLPAVWETWVPSLGWEDPLEKEMATHSSILAWRIPWTEEPGRLQSMGSRRVRHGWVTSLSLFAFMHWRRKWQPTPVFLPGESQGQGSLVGCRLWRSTESDTTEATWQQNNIKCINIHIKLVPDGEEIRKKIKCLKI